MSDIFILNGDIVWQGDDIYIVNDTDSVDQQAYLRASCDLGESIFYNDYGSRLFTYIGKPDTESNKALIETEAKETLLKVKGISEVIETSLINVNIDDKIFPCIYAKYKYEDSDTVIENTFKLSV